MATDPHLGSDLKQYTIDLLNSIAKNVDRFDKWRTPQIGLLAQYLDACESGAENQKTGLKGFKEQFRRAVAFRTAQAPAPWAKTGRLRPYSQWHARGTLLACRAVTGEVSS